MKKDICRAITFINYHIPPVLDNKIKLPYVTLGFFDGMLTELLDVCSEEGLKLLWKYSIKKTDQRLGQYSYQNIFCFSKDEWNQLSDESFWKEETNKSYPLTFVVFLQLKEYMVGGNSIELQCKNFIHAAERELNGSGICYTYNTIDKNDFVVCLKCREYKTAVDVIKNLHRTGVEIIYSYSVFSVSREILAGLQDKEYQYIFEEEIYSICLKGITNSYYLQNKITLDQKYSEFCNKLVSALYDREDSEKDYKIYDILGDDDFRLIARKIKLGNLLQQFAPGGLLCYEESSFQFYLFSSGIVLNTKTPVNDLDVIDDKDIKLGKSAMEKEFSSPFCDQLEKETKNISQIVSDNKSCKNEKIIAFCHAVWQLLQSLKPLETAPVKQYDFWSLYLPFSLLVKILEEKLEKVLQPETLEEDWDFVLNEEIYTFIHRISMTLHGTLRTDIQFFQIRDFNVIVHYAPAKLRAFYSFWVLRLTDYYNEFNEKGVMNEYSFILSPGIYQSIGVRELYIHYAETKRLMLIQVPERQLYAIRWFPVILAHEVSHFVGYASRQRKERHMACLKACGRVLSLEINFYRYNVSRNEWRILIKDKIPDLRFFKELEKELGEIEKDVRLKSGLYPHEFHSKNSIKIVKKTFRKVNQKFTPKILLEDSERINISLKNGKNKHGMSFQEQCFMIQEILNYSNMQYKELLTLNQKFESDLLPFLLEMLIYICKEAYADFIAILTLGLSPEEYIFSFSKGEFDLEEDRLQEKEGILLLVRAGLTMQAVMDAVEENSTCFSNVFCKEWEEDIFKKLPHHFSKDTIEGKMAIDIYGYMTGYKNFDYAMETYQSMYNYTENCFGNHLLDFFNDTVVRKYLINYLHECSKIYVKILLRDHIKEKQQKLLSTYNKIAEGSLSDMSQEIENFLADYEKSIIKK